jgi:hypothetical protein
MFDVGRRTTGYRCLSSVVGSLSSDFQIKRLQKYCKGREWRANKFFTGVWNADEANGADEMDWEKRVFGWLGRRFLTDTPFIF